MAHYWDNLFKPLVNSKAFESTRINICVYFSIRTFFFLIINTHFSKHLIYIKLSILRYISLKYYFLTIVLVLSQTTSLSIS